MQKLPIIEIMKMLFSMKDRNGWAYAVVMSIVAVWLPTSSYGKSKVDEAIAKDNAIKTLFFWQPSLFTKQTLA